ncbi:MAG: hypothetical protein J6Y80_04040 [Victivallales bacterium]|nr:hypothetical protein [Victivallales bacterium]
MKSPLIMAFHLAAALALSAAFVPQPQPVARQADEPGGTISYGNEYIRWEHEARTGRLVGAYVLNDSPENLLAAPLGFQVAVENGDGETELYENCGEPSSLDFGENEVAMTYKLCRNGHPDATLPLTVTHTIRYGEWGEATHHVHVEPAGRIARLLRLSPVVLTTTDKFDTCGAREMRVCGTDKWALSGVADWTSLRNESAEPYRCARVPLYLLLFKRGGAGIEFCLGSDLAQWEALGPRQNGILRRDEQRHAFEFTVSPFDSVAPRDLDSALDFDFRLTLPFVRPKMAPLRAAVSLLYFNRGAEHRWPTDEDLQELQAGGVSLMRLHNDCDFLHDGIFWRDAVYPPYPEAEMAKMDDCIARAAKFGLRVVPYFSMKEMHPEARWFAEHGLEWAKLNDPNGSVWVTGWTGGLVFGGVMCLKSGWLEVRKATIAEALKNHGFKGIYFDWCAAIECASTRHCDRHHWDIDEQIELLRWANALKGPDGEQ